MSALCCMLFRPLLCCRSCKLGLDRLCELVPRLHPRAFSIASSSLAHPGQVQLCVAIVQFKTPYKREKMGVCSAYLAGLKPGARVRLWIRPGTFTLPKTVATPVILVGPGTGVAPMRSILQERNCHRDQWSKQQNQERGADGNDDGERATTDQLFFGSR